MIRPDSVVNAVVINTGPNVTGPGGSNFILDITMVPRKALRSTRGNERAVALGHADSAAGGEEEPRRIGKRREGGCAERIGRDHMERLHAGMVREGYHDVIFDHVGVGIEPVQLRHLALKTADDRVSLIPNRLRTG